MHQTSLKKRFTPLRALALGLLIGLHFFHDANAQIDAGALQQNLEKQLPLPSPLGLPEPTPNKEDLPKKSTGKEVRFVVKQFNLEGINKLPEAEVQKTLSKWVGQSVDFNDLQEACAAVVQLYRSHGMTVQAILPPQKIANGVVLIRITEARLSKVTVESSSVENNATKEKVAQYITYANPIGDVLNMDSISRAIVILNETPGISVSGKLEPGQNDGETALLMDLNRLPGYQGRVEANNYGSRMTGANQVAASINIVNPYGFGHQLGINGIASEGSQYAQLNYSMPVTLSGLRIGASATALNYRNVGSYASSGNPISVIGGSGNPNGSYGDAWTAGINAAYPLIRSQNNNLNVIVSLDTKSYLNKSQLTQMVTSSYTINDLSAGLVGNLYDNFGGGGITNYSAYIVMGSFNPNGDSATGFGTYTPSNFSKFTFATNREQKLSATGNSSLFGSISGQLANVNLNAAEQFYLGGPYGVRAYPVAQSPGTQGMLATIELRQQLPRNFMMSAFFDAGMVQQFKTNYEQLKGLTNANNNYTLMGAGLGVKWNHQAWAVAASVAWKVGNNPLYSQTGQAVNVDGTTTNPRGWITGSYTF